MDLQTIIAELKRERYRIDRAIAALDGTPTRTTVTRTHGAKAGGKIVVKRREAV
jgi:hypothetical protein